MSDLAARIEHGFHSDDEAVVAAAWAALGRLPGEDPAVHLQRAFAALRMAQLTAPKGGDVATWTTDCLTQAKLGESEVRSAAEAAILTAACSIIAAGASVKAVLPRRRVEQTVERARALDPGNPRVALLEAWLAAAHGGEARDREVEQALRRAIVAFEARRGPGGVAATGWGEPEARAWLGALLLQRGEVRAARDQIEQALLLAPEYRYAMKLMDRFLAGQ